MSKKIFSLLLLLQLCLLGQSAAEAEMRSEAQDLRHRQFYAEALEKYLLLERAEANYSAQLRWDDFIGMQDCLQKLLRTDEIEPKLDALLARWPKDSYLHWQAANFMLRLPAWGIMQGGEFLRGERRGTGRQINVSQRDWRKALSLFEKARRLLEQDRLDDNQRGDFYLDYAGALFSDQHRDLRWLNRSGSAAHLARILPGLSWRLLLLSDLHTTPDWDWDDPYVTFSQGAPVNADGEPIYFALPQDFAAAKNDGERLRWLLQEAGNTDSRHQELAALSWANFAYALYGEYSLEQYRHIFFDEEEPQRSAAVLSLAQLSDCEALAQLADAPRRFTLPPDYCFIELFKRLQEAENKNVRLCALRRLAGIYENRQQYEEALHYLRLLEKLSPIDAGQRILQISGNLGLFMPAQVQTDPEKLVVDFKFRNAESLSLRLYRLDLPGILAKLQERIKTGDAQHHYYNLADLGRWINKEEGKSFIKEELRSWQERLEPLPRHADTLRSLEIAIPGPGSYWLEAELPGGQTSRIPLLSQPYMLLLKPLRGEQLWQLLRADTGEPAPASELQLFVWQTHWDQSLRRNKLLSTELSLRSDAQGCVYIKQSQLPKDFPANMQWLAWARPAYGSGTAFVCATASSYFRADNDAAFAPEPRGLLLSDRPIYKPGQTLQYKGWLKKPAYVGDCNVYAGKSAALWLQSPRGERIALSRAAWQKKDQDEKPPEELPELTFDANGGIAGQYQIPEQADLGSYSLGMAAEKVWGPGASQLTFRVEEYRKPDFELSWQKPEKPPRLGESFTVKLQARYYYGAPLSGGKAKIKVFRQPFQTQLLPWRDWDWLYGRGYWLPGRQSSRQGLSKIYWPGFFPRLEEAPELLQSLELELDEQGQCSIQLHTDGVLQLHGEQTQRFSFEALVEDASKRSISSNTTLLLGKKAFTAYSWSDRGYYHSGGSVEAQVQLRSLEGNPAPGKGMLQLYRLTYEQPGQIVETLQQQWDCQLDAQGRGSQRLLAAKAGQYKLLWKLSPQLEPEEIIEASNIINVYGSKAQSGDFQFRALELICEKSEYAVGEQVLLRINSQYADSLVYLYLRPENGLCKRPRLIRLNGHSAELAIPVLPEDMPNFFIEAQLVGGGQLHQSLRSIVVPPAKKTLQLEIEPLSSQMQPGEQAELTLSLKDWQGRPFVGELVVAVYDKSLESFGEVLPEDLLKRRFWSWTRRHDFSTQSMSWQLNHILYEKDIRMEHLGLYVEPALLYGAKNRGFAAGAVADGDMMLRSAKAAAPSARMAKSMPEASAEEAFADTALRQDFADTAFWSASLPSGLDGKARLSFTLPDDLSTWKLRVWAMSEQCEVGEAQGEIVSSKKMTVRLSAPRFFLERDEVLLTAVLRHELPQTLNVRGLLELEGGCLELLPGAEAAQDLEIEPNRDVLLKWPLAVKKSGEAIIRVKALSAKASDAMQQSFPVKVYGLQQQEPFCGRLEAEQGQGRFSFELPAQLSPGSARFELAWSPSLALSMLEALPELSRASLGTSEQRLNSFLPALLLRQSLLAAGFSAEDLAESKVILNPQKLSDDPRAAPNPAALVYDEQRLQALLQKGLRDLLSMRCADGGWGWFSGWGERSSAHLSAQIVHGLLLARKNGVLVEDSLLEPGLQWLQNYQLQELVRLQMPKESNEHKSLADNLDALVLKVLCETPEPRYNPEMAELLYRDRRHLSLYGKALFALAEFRQGQALGRDLSKAEKLLELMRALRQFLREDNENQSAYLLLPQNIPFWYWYGDAIETQAIYLQLLCLTGEAKSRQAAGLVKYLLNNRRHGSYWNSSRDTAAVIEAFCTYLEGSGELAGELEVQIAVDGKNLAQSSLHKGNLLSANQRLILEAEQLGAGKHEIRIEKKGASPLYFNAYLSYFNLADEFDEAGLELKVQRRMYRLEEVIGEQAVPDKLGQVTMEKRDKYKRHLLPADAKIEQGELLEVELLLESKNDYEYIIIEDHKAAGCESLEQLSGYQQAGALWPYIEYRQDRVCLMLSWLPQGKHSLTYRLKVESAGCFSALPAVVKGVYAPELQGNSRRQRLLVIEGEDKKAQ
ncbi:MAG: hypothetical protein GX901_05500 [Lentisphaerae bacterium]|nr:hypothetical protein [Lentisphaerota bacterium]